MNWSDLQCLNAFKRSGPLQEAARVLGVNHTTVSRRIRQLEKTLGCSLVETVNGRLRLTSAGHRAAETCERISGEALALERELRGRDVSVSGNIRVGLLDYFLTAHAKDLADFSACYPEVRLELCSSGSQLHNLVRREADVVIRIARAPRDTLVGRKVAQLEYAPFARDTLAAKGPMEALPWIGWDRSVGAQMTDAWMAERLREDQVCFRVDSTSAMFDLANAGAGVALLPVKYARGMPELVQLGEVIPGFETAVWILTHRDLAQLERVRLLIRFLAERMCQ